jgi:ComF family protein
MVERYLGEKLNTPDIILPVPSSKETKRKKGYNHSECLAKVIGKILNIEYKNNVLLKGRNTTMQKGLHYLERLENLKDAFYIKNAEIINNKVLLLIDDIYTTGATTDECSKILKENGAKEVQILTLAIGKGFS